MKLEITIETKKQAEKLIEQLKGFVEKKESLYPNVGDNRYCYITEVGCVSPTKAITKDVGSEQLANIYETPVIAQKALDFKKKNKVFNFIENWWAHNSTFVADWDDYSQEKYNIYYDYKDKTWEYKAWNSHIEGCAYFSRKEVERLLKILNSSGEYKL